jgi:threonine synthase
MGERRDDDHRASDRARVELTAFVPERAPEAKVAQLLIYGATVLLVEGSYDDAVELCLAACKQWGWYCRNTGYNPHTTEGKKTCALEIKDVRAAARAAGSPVRVTPTQEAVRRELRGRGLISRRPMK